MEWWLLLIGVNRPNVSGANYNQSAIYFWDGYATSWNVPPVPVSGKIGALFTHNGTTYVWWKDNDNVGGCNFGYFNGSVLTVIKRYDGSLLIKIKYQTIMDLLLGFQMMRYLYGVQEITKHKLSSLNT